MNLLQNILRQKQSELAALPDHLNVEPTRRNFVGSLRSQSPCLIAEIKPKSPSAGILLEMAAIAPTVAAYNRRAQAISVLCDRTFFGGGFDLVHDVRLQTHLPILAKEFILNAKQIRAARHAGADAVLLIAALLEADTLHSLCETARELNMGVLLELHDTAEIDKIPALSEGSLVIGINNRNLATLAMDLGTTGRLASPVRKRFPRHLLLSESGLKTSADVQRVQPCVDGFLIGTGLLTGDLLPYFPSRQ